MEIVEENARAPFIKLINDYEQSFRDRDIHAFRTLHVSDRRAVFFDNHPNCDLYSYADHERKVVDFFKQGEIVDLLRENVRIFVTGAMACVTAVHRYSSRPSAAVRTTYVLEQEGAVWKIRHIHQSFDPIATNGA